MSDIIIKNLYKSYENEKVLNNFNSIIKSNEFNIIVGSSGIGKTTLIRILMKLEKEDSGKIINIPKNISPVFQENRLLENLNIYENINFTNEKISHEEIDKELEKINLNNIGNKKIKELSGGMKRRVTILRAILKEADLYIFDEPFKEMDEEVYKMVIKYVKEKLSGKTVIFSTHNKEEIDYFKANKIEIV